jgi:hypothetical protein
MDALQDKSADRIRLDVCGRLSSRAKHYAYLCTLRYLPIYGLLPGVPSTSCGARLPPKMPSNASRRASCLRRSLGIGTLGTLVALAWAVRGAVRCRLWRNRWLRTTRSRTLIPKTGRFADLAPRIRNERRERRRTLPECLTEETGYGHGRAMRSLMRFIGFLVYPRLVRDPVHFPSPASVTRKGLLKVNTSAAISCAAAVLYPGQY